MHPQSKPRKTFSLKERIFLWEGRNREGKVVLGEIRASSESSAKLMLRRQGIQVQKIVPQKLGRRQKITDKEITFFTRQLATLLKAGVPLLQSLDIIGRGHANPSAGQLLLEIKSNLEAGSSLSQAFRRHPLHFNALYCNLIAAGEQAGILEAVLERLANYKEKIRLLQSKIKSALFYPAAVLSVAFIVTAVIMVFVIPAFKEVFRSFGADLPSPTLFVIALSDAFIAYGWLMLAVVVGGIYALLYVHKRSERLQMVFDRYILKAPLIGSIIRQATVARWTRTLATLFGAGVPLVECLDSVAGAAGNHVYKLGTRQIQATVNSGTSLTVAMQSSQLFDNMVVQMVAIGEESGSLDAMLDKIADFLEAEVDAAVSALSSLMEPVMMVVLGVLIGGLVIAMYLPIFKLGSVVG